MFQNVEEINQSIRSLNIKQKPVFDYILKWREENLIKLKEMRTLSILISRFDRVGNLHLINIFCQRVTKLLQYYGGSPEKPQVVVLEPTGVVSINVSGADRVMPIILVTLVAFRNKHSEVQLIVLDKISMVSKKECYQMHYCCVIEIFNLSN